jgi:hypothetical protein
MCTPEVEKKDRQLIVWSHSSLAEFSDTVCVDFDNLAPSKFLAKFNVLSLIKNHNYEPILKSIVAVMESSNFNTHVLIRVANQLTTNNYKRIYTAIAEELGSNYDKSCNDLFRGFFAPNRIVFFNPDAIGYEVNPVYPPLQPPNSIYININKLSKCGGQNQEIGEFVKGNRHNFLFKTLFKMAQKRGGTGSWMEETAYPHIQEDFQKEEIDKIITWIRKKYRTNPKIENFQVTYGLYKNMREIGQNHEEAFNSVLYNASERTQERYRAKFNKEFGIVQKGGTNGKTWKRKKIVDNNNTITKEAV